MSKNSKIYISGIAFFPVLNRPDTKFDELGQYKANVIVDGDTAAPIIKDLQARAKAHLGKVLPKSKNNMFQMVLDDDGEETGDVQFKITVKNRLNKQGKLWDRRPMIIDAKMKPMSDDINVWGGSTIKVQAEVYEWAFGGKKGISLQPLVVQVLDLVTGNGQADLSGFGEEDGYIGEETDTTGFADESKNPADDMDDGDSDY